MRLFAAIPLPTEAILLLERLQAGLPEGREVPGESFHITLGFFDECDRHVAADIDSGLAAIRGEGFPLHIDGIGMFGGAAPRILHAVVRADPALTRLRARVLTAGRDAGLDLRRERFIPHVTLARFAPGQTLTPDLDRWLAARVGIRGGPWPATAFCLYRSDRSGAGPVYTELVRYPLG